MNTSSSLSAPTWVSLTTTPIDNSSDFFEHASTEQRHAWVRSLIQAPPDFVCSVLHKILNDDDWRVRTEGVLLVQNMGAHPNLVNTLVQILCVPTHGITLRNSAVQALATLGLPAVESLERVWTSASLDVDTRKLILDTLVLIRQPYVVPLALQALNDSAINIRAAAAEVLGLVGGSDAIKALLSLLDSPKNILQLTALNGLNRLHVFIPFEQSKHLIKDPILRYAVVHQLSSVSDFQAFELILATLEDVSSQTVTAAIQACATWLKHHQSPSLLPVIRTQCKNVPSQSRQRIFRIIEKTIHPNSYVDFNPDLTLSALILLSYFDDEQATLLLIQALFHEQFKDVSICVAASITDAACSLLFVRAYQGAELERTEAIRILSHYIEYKDEAFARKVMILLRDSLYETSRSVLQSALHFALPSVWELPQFVESKEVFESILENLCRLSLYQARELALSALHWIRDFAAQWPLLMKPHLKWPDPSSKEALITCGILTALGTQEHFLWLSRAASSEDSLVRQLAIEALCTVGGYDAMQIIALALTDESAEVVHSAIRALGRIRSHDHQEAIGVPTLLVFTPSTREHAYWSTAIEAIGNTHDARAIDALKTWAICLNETFACAAMNALSEQSVDDFVCMVPIALRHSSALVVQNTINILTRKMNTLSLQSVQELYTKLESLQKELEPKMCTQIAAILPTLFSCSHAVF